METDLGAESARPGDPVEVGVRVLRHVVVEHDVHALDVHATTEQVRRHQDALLEVLELLVPALIEEFYDNTHVDISTKKITSLTLSFFTFHEVLYFDISNGPGTGRSIHSSPDPRGHLITDTPDPEHCSPSSRHSEPKS